MSNTVSNFGGRIMDKIEKLSELLKSYGKVCVAYSGGVDSTFLLSFAVRTLGRENVLAATVRASINPSYEIDEAEEMLKALGIDYLLIDSDVFAIEGFRENPVDRCYICKTAIFRNIIKKAGEKGFDRVVDGTNADDEGDYRPGMKALAELKVASPLKESGLTKAEIRSISKDMDLATWDKPSLACLASRIPYHEEITEQKLRAVEAAEKYLFDKGFRQLRVRCHGNLARIELSPDELDKLFDAAIMRDIDTELKKLGFKYAALDLLGYRTGSLNEVLK